MSFDDFILVICNGDPPSSARVRELIPNPRLIACADGGANKAMLLGYKPDIVVGDLDSLVESGSNFNDTEIIKNNSQNNTDFEKTLDVLIYRGFQNFLVISFSGGRIDQTLANLQIAYEYSKKCVLVLADDLYLIFPAIKNLDLNVETNTDISIIPIEDETSISTDGLEYELHQAFLRKGGQGISNRATKNKIEITVHKGGALVFVGLA